jgi:hypothetical protein
LEDIYSIEGEELDGVWKIEFIDKS